MSSSDLPAGDEFDIFAEDEATATGEFQPCAFSDDEEDEHGDACACPLCQHGDGGTGEAHHVLERMRALDEELSGRVSDQTIFKLQADLYREHVQEPLKRQGVEVPEVTASDCKSHFNKHYINPKRMMASEIKFVNTIQSHVRKQKILSRNTVTGETRINDAAVRQWLQLSRHKMDLVKFYRGQLSKTQSSAKTIKPYSFT